MSRIKVAFALRLVDDFSGQSIRGKKFWFTKDGRPVSFIDKGDGLCVFLEPKEREGSLLIHGADYYPRSVRIPREPFDPEKPVRDVRLYGRPGGNFPYKYELFVGALEASDLSAGTEVVVERSRPVGLTFRELKREGDERWLVFQGFTKEELLGRLCVLGGNVSSPPFVLTKRRGVNEYCAGELPEGALEKAEAGAPLVRVYRSVAESSGAYAVPVENREECRLLTVLKD